MNHLPLHQKYGLTDPEHRGLRTVVRQYKPTVLIGSSGQSGAFTQEVIETRIRNAAAEMAESHAYMHQLVNDDLDECYAALRTIYIAAGAREARDAASFGTSPN